MLRRTLGSIVLLAAAVATPDRRRARHLSNSAADRWRSFDVHHASGVQAFAAQAEAPLTGTGENLELVANEPGRPGVRPRAARQPRVRRLLRRGHGDHRHRRPDEPEARRHVRVRRRHRSTTSSCAPTARSPLLTTDGGGSTCHNGEQGSMVIDVSDPAQPRELAFIPIKNADGSHRRLAHPHARLAVPLHQPVPDELPPARGLLARRPGQPDEDRRARLRRGPAAASTTPTSTTGPTARRLLYAASVSANDVVDVTDPRKPEARRSASSTPRSRSRTRTSRTSAATRALVTDEYLGGAAGPSCGKVEDRVAGVAARRRPERRRPERPRRAAPLRARGRRDDRRQARRPSTSRRSRTTTRRTAARSTSSGRRPTRTASSPRGTAAASASLDYSDPESGRGARRASSRPATNVWAAKPHNGYIFTGDLNRGLDVLQYTGEGGRVARDRRRRPRRSAPRSSAATAGPARRPRCPTPPPAPAGHGHSTGGPATAPRRPVRRRACGRCACACASPAAGRRTVGAAHPAVRARAAILGTVRYRVRAGRPRHAARRASPAPPGRYRYRVRCAAGASCARGRLTLNASPGVTVLLPPGRKLLVTRAR